MLRHLRTALGTLGALWTLVSLSAPTQLHPCPSHGGGTHATHVANELVPGSGHTGHEGHDTTAAAALSEVSPASTDTPPRCDCVGGCCPSSPVGLAIASPALLEVAVPAAGATARLAPAIAPARELAHRLPFANGPPTLVS